MAGVKGQVQKRGVERRRAMVDAAIGLFSQQGVRGTGVAAIAERAGVTPSALIHHFGSKDGLVRAVLEEADRRALARLSATPTSEPTLTEAFGWFVRDAEHTAAAERELTALHTTLTAENLEPGTTLHTWFRDRGRALRAHLTALFTRAATDGSARPDVDPAALATEVAAFLEGAHLLWLLDPDQVDLPAVHRGYFEGLAARLRP
ncbi:TetR/AcrR family transcriptional regulator [Streptomyces sp. NPDC002787]